MQLITNMARMLMSALFTVKAGGMIVPHPEKEGNLAVHRIVCKDETDVRAELQHDAFFDSAVGKYRLKLDGDERIPGLMPGDKVRGRVDATRRIGEELMQVPMAFIKPVGLAVPLTDAVCKQYMTDLVAFCQSEKQGVEANLAKITEDHSKKSTEYAAHVASHAALGPAAAALRRGTLTAAEQTMFRTTAALDKVWHATERFHRVCNVTLPQLAQQFSRATFGRACGNSGS